MKMVRVANPARRRVTRRRKVRVARRKGNPSQLAIVTGGKTMAARRSNPRRRRRSRRRASTRRRNPVYRVRAAPRRANRRYVRRRRRSNPTRRRRFSARRRNPAITGLITKAAWVGGGVFLTDMAQGLIPLSVSNPLARIGIRFGVAWGVGAVAGRFVGQSNAELLALGGMAGAAQDLIRLLWGGFSGVFGPAQQQQLPAGYTQQIDSGDVQGGMGMITYATEGYEAIG